MSGLERLVGKRALLYGRVSTAVQESDGYSLAAQKRDGHAAAERLGAVIVGEDFEQGSGQDWDLSGFKAIQDMAAARAFDVLILKNVSRLSRKRGKQAYMEHLLADAGAELYYYDESYEDSAAGRLQRGLMAEIAEFQLEQTRELSIEARRAKVEHHRQPVGNGQMPYGWKRIRDADGARKRTVGYEHDEQEAAIIRRLSSLRTLSVADLCDVLNAEGIPSPGVGRYKATEKRPCSGAWKPSAIWGILTNRMTWGEYRYGARQVVKRQGKSRVVVKDDAEDVTLTLQLEPILPKREVDELVAVLVSRVNAKRRGATPRDERSSPFLLTGRLACGHCGGTLAGKVGGGPRYRMTDDYRTYGCLRHLETYARRHGHAVCPFPALIATRRPGRGTTDGIEELIWHALRAALLDRKRLARDIERSQRGADGAEAHEKRLVFHRKQIERTMGALQRASDQWSMAEDEFDRETFGATRLRLKAEIKSLTEELATLEAYVPNGISKERGDAILALRDNVVTLFERDDLKADERRTLLRDLQVTATVTAVEDGPYLIGRHRYQIVCGGVMDLGRYLDVVGDSLCNFQKFRMRSQSIKELGLEFLTDIQTA